MRLYELSSRKAAQFVGTMPAKSLELPLIYAIDELQTFLPRKTILFEAQMIYHVIDSLAYDWEK